MVAPKIVCLDPSQFPGEAPTMIQMYGRYYSYLTTNSAGKYCYEVMNYGLSPLGAGGGSHSPQPSPSIVMVFDSPSNVPVSNVHSVANWNTLFNLPALGTPFSTVATSINGGGQITVTLSGGNAITLKANLLSSNTHLISFSDVGNCVYSVGNSAFQGCTSLILVSLPVATTYGTSSLQTCSSLITFSTSASASFGDHCFQFCNALTTFTALNGTSFGLGCFRQCFALVNFNVNNATSFGDQCFEATGFVNFSTISPASFGANCFGSCASLSTFTANNAVSFGSDCFFTDAVMISFSATAATTYGDLCFDSCTGITTLAMNHAATLGANIWNGITGNNITLTIATTLASDANVVSLQGSNTVTLILV